MKFVYKIFLLLCVTSLWFSLSSYESGAAANRRSATGAPFGNGNCGSCHNGGTYGTVNVSVQIFEVGTTTAVTAYTGGKTYDAKLSITSTTAAPFYAFQMVSVNAANAQAGTWSGFPTNVKGTLLAARTYVEQSVKLTASSYKMTWVAPAAGTGAVKFYACGNAVDASGDETGDNTGVTTVTLNEQTVVACTSATVTSSSVNAACVGSATGSAMVTPSGGRAPYIYLWSNGATTQTASNLVAGSYTVTVTEGGGCKTPVSAITVGANAITAAITPSGSTALCTGGSVNLTASGGTSYLWSTGATTATLSNITAAGTYAVTATTGTCTAIASQAVTVAPLVATITPSGPTTFCPGGSVTLTATGGTTYKWSTGATGATLSNVITGGTYAVTATSGTCTATASQIVTVSNTATANIVASGATAMCSGGSVNLTATGGGTYKWSTGTTTATLSNVTTAGTYSVTVTNGTCTATASKVITMTPSPIASITASGATAFCQGGSVDLTASGGTTYTWSTGGTTATLSNILTSGTYAVTVANGACTATGSKIITVLPAPVAAIAASSAQLCQGSNVNLTASGGAFYTWSNGSNAATISATTAGTYAVTVSNGSCTGTASKTLVVSPTPTASIVASGPTSFCQGGSVTLTGAGGATYLWSNGATTASTIVSTAGTYTVSVTNNGCVGTTSKAITTIPAPSVSLTSTPSYGTNGMATATVTGGTPPYLYDWSNNATNFTLIGLKAGTYFVTVTDANGCTGEGSVVVGISTAVNDLNAQFPVSISPIPNDGHFILTLELPTEQNVHVDVFNMVGQKVDKKVLYGKSISERMDVSNLPSGQYLVRINTESGIATRWMMLAK
jgi:hypothetical protein